MAARKAKDTQNPKAGGGAGDTETGDEPPITIKKYANRRLYNTATSSYVTLDHLCQMVKDGVDFAVYDAKSGEDITRSVLTQIIVEEEGKTGQNLLPISFLRQLIAFYGDNAQQMMLPQYLDLSIRSFAENQEKMRDYMKDTLGSVFPFDQLEEVGKKNMAMFEKTMQLFSPFGGVGQSGGSPDNDRTEEGARKDAEKEVDALEKELAELRRELDALKSQKK